jgi:hypothetical protein
MATFEENFLYPLILFLVGAGVSSVTTTWAAHVSENRKRARDRETEYRRREVEIKVDITSKMAEAQAELDAQATFLIYRGEELEKEEKNSFFQNAKKRYMGGKLIHSKLEVYFPGTAFRMGWDDYYDLLNDFVNATQLYFEQDPVKRKDLKFALNRIRGPLFDKKPINWENLGISFNENQWLDIQNIIRSAGDELINDILKAHPHDVI